MWGLIPIGDGPVIIIQEGYYNDKSSKENFEFFFAIFVHA